MSKEQNLAKAEADVLEELKNYAIIKELRAEDQHIVRIRYNVLEESTSRQK